MTELTVFRIMRLYNRRTHHDHFCRVEHVVDEVSELIVPTQSLRKTHKIRKAKVPDANSEEFTGFVSYY